MESLRLDKNDYDEWLLEERDWFGGFHSQPTLTKPPGVVYYIVL